MAPEQPKKPAGGAYGQFMAEKRPEYIKACAGQPITAVSKMAGQAWKEISEAQKKPYEDKYAAAKAQFEVDMAAFLAAGGEKTKGAMALRSEKRKLKEGKKLKKEKNADMPKKVCGGGYGQYLAQNRTKIVESLPKNHKITDVSKAAGAQWKGLSEAAKKPYEDMYAQKQLEYKKTMEEYKESHPDAAESEHEATPEKRSMPKDAKTSSPAAKRGRVAKKGAAPTGMEIEEKVLKQAEGLKMVAQLKNLAARPDIVSSGKSAEDMLDALRKSDGLVNKAKAALLGA